MISRGIQLSGFVVVGGVSNPDWRYTAAEIGLEAPPTMVFCDNCLIFFQIHYEALTKIYWVFIGYLLFHTKDKLETDMHDAL